jgi:hypothetical protein
MDPVITAVVKAATKETAGTLKKESESFLGAVLGEPAKALGGLIADKVNKRRHANLIKITVEAKRNLQAAGVSPKEVPLSIIHPALEAASLEENPDLQTAWANLLANAADPRHTGNVPPTFVAILKELTPGHAIMLTALFKDACKKAERKSVITDVLYDIFDIKQIYAPYTPPPGTRHAIAVDSQFLVMVEILKLRGVLTERTGGTPQPNRHPKYSLSDLGIAFVRACQAPAK